MKKTLVAVAALVATGAFAEVTIGGNLNQGYTTTTTDGTTTKGLSAASNSSFLTFSGSEDLGSGLKASFKYEAGVSVNGGNTFGGSREGWIGLSGAFGSVKVGQQYSDIFNTVVGTDPNGFNNITGWGPATAMLNKDNGYSLLAATDTISYTLPTLVEGLTVGVQSFRPNAMAPGAYQLATGAAFTEIDTPTVFGATGSSYGVSYVNGGLFASVAGRTAGADKSTAYAVSYNFGVAKVAYTNIDSTIAGTLSALGAGAAVGKTTDSTYTISAPVGDNVTVGYSSGTYKIDDVKTANSQAGVYYNLSKRTQLYGIFGKSSADATNSSVTSFGVNHSF